MKSTILHLLSLFLIVGFASSCGKKEGGGGGSSNVGNPLIDGNTDAQTQQNYQIVRNWYDGATDNNGIGAIFLKETKTVSSGNGGISFTGGICFGFINIGNCSQNTQVQPNGCLQRVSNAMVVATPIINNNQTIGCNINGVAPYVKANNTDLTRAITGNGLKLISAQRISTSNYVLGYAPVGYYNPTVYFEINTAAHSALNPVGIQENSKLTTVKFQAY